MARNLAFRVLRGVKANMPVLNPGELYLAIDELQLYVGTSVGNLQVLLSQIGIPNGPPNQGVVVRKQGTGGGPTSPQNIVAFTKTIINGTVYWAPLMQ